jgi:hypothetical protein
MLYGNGSEVQNRSDPGSINLVLIKLVLIKLASVLPRAIVIRCKFCGTQNVEPAGGCQQCGAVLDASPTMSISSEMPPG